MAKMQRKDYAAAAVVDHSQETLKRVHTMNTPFSVQSLGLHHNKEKHIPVTSENVDALETNTRYIEGNVEGYVKTVTQFEGATTEVVFGYLKDGEEVTKTLTKDELLDSQTIFFTTTD
jgi:hypothetical protein